MKLGITFILTSGCLALDFHMTDLDFKFVRYMNEFNKSYSGQEEFDMRRQIFAEAEEAIK